MGTRSKYIRTLPLVLSAALLVPLVAACSKQSADDPNNRHTLRIGLLSGSSDSESYYRQEYTDMFEMTHQNIDIEFVTAVDYSDMQFATQEEQQKMQEIDPVEKMKEIMTGDNPVDVLILDTGTMGKLAQDNLLMPLEPKIKEDKVNLEDYVPTVIDTIREAGNGQLYGLSPTFSSSVLFYNKTLFDKMGVTLPTDGMMWDDVFNLARRLTSGTGQDATFGLTLNDWGAGLNYYNIQSIYSPLKLRMYDDKGETMTVDTAKWEEVWSKPIELYQDHVFPRQEDMQVEQPQDGTYQYNPYQDRPFFTNRVGMVIGSYSTISDLNTYNQNVDKMDGYSKIDWGIVTYPQLPEAPGVGGGMYISQLASINASAQNPEDAWEYIKFVNSKESAKFKSRSTYELSTLKEFIKPKDGMTYNMQAFYQLKPIPDNASDSEIQLYRERPNIGLISQLAEQSFQKALNGDMTVKEALADLQTKGNELLQKIKENPTGQIDMSAYVDYGGMYGTSEAAAVARAAGVG
ncbi:ABC transporter substrate-binding protein [Cohnella lubricantis]|uniref:Extracellular solute-binding protein n=1 Tax=Cohnella lubricantis TaxID=2163172 RepID=A0A841TDG9_9BACL|nr:extracellular solute-binding protein [Cohnella lubricantis]MBB6677280.1 extracellular solute-binding protein [Cohnella lubricantis]MBP2116908.1 multiple sugar transport system substrate-binding protein [Cohnella lubricantis]